MEARDLLVPKIPIAIATFVSMTDVRNLDEKVILLSLYKNISIVAVAGLLLPIAVFGAPSANAAVNWFNSILDNFLAMILWPVFAALVVIMFIYAGFMYLTAHGDAA